MELRIALAQIPVTTDTRENIAVISEGIKFAKKEKAKILLTPEGSLSGYTHKFKQAAVEDALEYITMLAQKNAVGLALGTCFKEPENDNCYNQLRFYSSGGKYLGFHSKILTCSDPDNPSESENKIFSSSTLRSFMFEGIRIGGLICNDMWANPCCTSVPDPHLSTQLVDMDVQIIFHAVNGGRNGSDWSRSVIWPYHETNLRMRARAGKSWIVTVDNSHPVDLPCSSPSGVIDPEGNWVCRTKDKGQQFACYTIKI